MLDSSGIFCTTQITVLMVKSPLLPSMREQQGIAMNQIVGFRRTATGVWRYEFFTADQLIGTVSSLVGPNAVVRIEAPAISWYSSFSMDTTIVPGISRRVKDNTDGEPVYRIIYCQPGFYRMMRGADSLLVERRNGAYLFGNQGMPVLAMTERIEEWQWLPGRDYEPYFLTTVYEENVGRELLMALLSFPMLRFY